MNEWMITMENVTMLKQAIDKLSEYEAKNLLLQLLNRSETSSDSAFVTDISIMQQSIIQTMNILGNVPRANTVHIVFSQAAAKNLRSIFSLLDDIQTNQVIALPSLLAIGPMANFHTEQGRTVRGAWLKERLRNLSDWIDATVQHVRRGIAEIQAITPGQEVVIWVCNNAQEQTGLRVVLALLKNYSNQISVFNAFDAFHVIHTYSQLAEENYPRVVEELTADECQLLYDKYAIHPLSAVQRQSLEEEGWNILNGPAYTIRTWENHTLLNDYNENRDDELIVHCAKALHAKQHTKSVIPVLRLVGEVIGQMKEPLADEWIEYRIRQLIAQGLFTHEGELNTKRWYSVELVDASHLK